MSEDTGYAERFLCALFATVMKPISDLRLLISGSCRLPFALSSLSTLLFALCSPVEAQQQEKVPRIGVLSVASLTSQAPRYEAFREGLRELGYVEGRNILIEYRSAEGKPDRVPMLASELVRLNVDCIITAGGLVTRAARQVTSTIPIIMTTVGDHRASLLASVL